MNNQLIKPEEFGLKENQAEGVALAFKEKTEERELLSKIYAELITKDINKETAKEARNLRLKAVKIKSGIAAIHRSQKEFALSFGKFCDAWKNKETEPVQQMIDGLLEIEKHEEIQEQKRIEKLQADRAEKLRLYVEDADERDLAKFEDDEFEALLAMKKKEQEDRVALEKKAEEERIAKEKAETEERERISKENERLRKEAEERERQAKIEAEKRAKEERERQAKAEAERKLREENERKEREAYEAKLNAERKEKEKIQRELKAKAEAERKEKEEEKARIEAELRKGDADKVIDLINDLKLLKEKYNFKSAKNKKMYLDVGVLIDKTIVFIS